MLPLKLVEWSFSVSAGHERQLCQNGWTDSDAVWGVDSWGHALGESLGSPTGFCLSMPIPTRGQYFQRYSPGASSDATCGYRCTVAIFFYFLPPRVVALVRKWRRLHWASIFVYNTWVATFSVAQSVVCASRDVSVIIVVVVTFFNHSFVNCKATLILEIKIYEIKYNMSLNDVHT